MMFPLVNVSFSEKRSCSVVSGSLRPHGPEFTSLLHPWNFPRKSTRVGCHFLLEGIFPTQGSNQGLQRGRQMLDCLSHQGSPMLVAQLCPTLCDAMDCSLPGSSVHGLLQARILEWVAISFSRGSSQPRDQTKGSRVAGRFFMIWATGEAYPHSIFVCLLVVYFPN